MTDGEFVEAFLKVKLNHKFAKVAEGIGRVAVAASWAEFVVDMLGRRLIAEPDDYLVLTKGMSLGRKTDCVRKMCRRTLILDEKLKEQASVFCKKLKALLDRRNESIHSLIIIYENDILHIRTRPPTAKRVSVITPEEQFDLDVEIEKLVVENSSLIAPENFP